METINAEYTVESLENVIPYILGIYSGLIDKNIAVVEIIPEYAHMGISKVYNLNPLKLTVPTFYEKRPFCVNENLYHSFLQFATMCCTIKNHQLIKIKSTTLIKEFASHINTSPDNIKHQFPKIMDQFIKQYPFVTKRGAVYTGINLTKYINSAKIISESDYNNPFPKQNFQLD